MKTITMAQQSLPALGMGSWRIGQQRHPAATEIQALQYGIDTGLTVIDTAEMYGSGDAERLIGEAIQNRPRDQIYLVSKIYPWHANPQQMTASCDASLARLNTDYLDLYLLHWRSGERLAEVVEGMEALKAAGKIRNWGVSNFKVHDMEQLLALPGGEHCVTNQVAYHLGNRAIEQQLLPWSQEHNMPLMAYSPLGGHRTHLLENATLQAIAERHGVSPAAIALAWVIRHPNMLAIPESGSAEHIEQNKAALALSLTDEDIAQLNAEFPTN